MNWDLILNIAGLFIIPLFIFIFNLNNKVTKLEITIENHKTEDVASVFIEYFFK